MAKLGLLMCDHVREELKAIGGDYDAMFQSWLENYGDHWTFYDVTNDQFPRELHECDAYVISGSRYSVYEDLPWIAKAKELVLQLNLQKIKTLGVCFGHQLLAEALGGKVEKATKGWSVGIHEITILKEESWQVPKKPTVNVLMMCQDQVVKLPEKARLLGTSPHCRVAMFRLGHHLLGIQGHPEFTKEYEQALMILRRDIIGEPVYSHAKASLAYPADATMLKNWVRTFLKV